MNVEQARFNMIEQQIRPWNVLDGQVLDLLGTVRREDFVPIAHRALAFSDLELPLRGQGEQGQCMLAPRVEARMLQDLALRPGDRVLEIGAGSGYMAALMAHRAQHVLTLEIVPELVSLACANLQRAGITNVEVRQADGAHGASTDGPFDVIVLSGSVAEVPSALLQQLKVGGRLMAVVGEGPMMRATRMRRASDTQFESLQGWDTVAPRLLNFAEPPRFRF